MYTCLKLFKAMFFMLTLETGFLNYEVHMSFNNKWEKAREIFVSLFACFLRKELIQTETACQ